MPLGLLCLPLSPEVGVRLEKNEVLNAPKRPSDRRVRRLWDVRQVPLRAGHGDLPTLPSL